MLLGKDETPEKTYIIDGKEYSLKKMSFNLHKIGFKYLNKLNLKNIELGAIVDKVSQVGKNLGKGVLSGDIQAETISEDSGKIVAEVGEDAIDEVKSLIKKMEDLNDESDDIKFEFMQKVLSNGENLSIDGEAFLFFSEVRTDFFSRMSGSKNSAQPSETFIPTQADSHQLKTESTAI